MNVSAEILGLYIGAAKHRWEGKSPSAIGKSLAERPLQLTQTGFEGDEQADLTVHGGPEKALHHYSADHMSAWREEFPEKAEFFQPGCFGENISSRGLDENNLCLGDVLTMGTAKVQICQGRQPCWKLSLHTDLPQMAARFQKTGRTGWYYRVIEAGMVQAGDTMSVIERPHDQWVLAKLIKARFNPKLDAAVAEELSKIPSLSQNWQASFVKKMNAGFKEDASRRLLGDTAP
ncbi:6-N-hydroxylaminopurine resistance protein [Pseudovibrio axinellae]|uniref:6-N-hydroxylaminopurine resistance protein n=1 Tax=Pseudovibrio axinellae TaxID=989403 RepID=A0A165U1S3_9HYPH|nr:MOSC domain-containing protein [Pseudovibrio axinellae]KZL09453.1 6-N-hydroxylaminopurine resistance protein [Pseudovibrio axinellae]SEQ64420.1 MOSC domain-containing protein YiiM [Pseudovibrio axinellae]